MKIFVICNSLGRGGAERVGVNLANGFIGHGHEVCIVTDVHQKKCYPTDARIKLLPLYGKNEGKIQRWGHAVSNIRKYAKQEKPDCIIGIMHLASIVAWLGCKGLHIPVILCIHHAVERIKSEQLDGVTKFFDQQISKIYRHVAVLTQADRAFLHNRKGIFVMPNPASFTTVETIPQKEKVLIAAGHVGRWHYKGFDVLVEAWGKISKKYPDWKLQLAGTGESKDMDFIKSLMERYHVEDSMELLGYRTDMEQLFQKASIFVLSSRSEGLPMVLIEAMSQGCAPVATDFKGRTREIIPTDNEGILCNPEDAEALAAGMLRLIEDDTLRQNIQRNAAERSKFYALDNIVGMWEKVLSQCTMHNA